MFQKFILLFAVWLLAFPLAAQCELTATVSEVECTSSGGDYTFRLTIDGGDSIVRFVGLDFELPLPVDNYFTTTSEAGTFVVTIESGEGDDACQTTFTLAPPEDCEPTVPDCFVRIDEITDGCGVPETLAAVGSGTAPFTYAWSTGDTTASVRVTDGVFSYSVTLTDADGCENFANAHVFGGGFFVHVASEGNPCGDASPPRLTATVFQDASSGVAPYTYAWSNGETTRSILVDIETEYTVTVTDANGCSSVGYGFYHPGNFINFLTISGPETASCDGSPITLSIDNPDPDFVYQWINGFDTLRGSSIEITEGAFFQVEGFNPDQPGCVLTGFVSVAAAVVDASDLRVIQLSGDGCSEEHVCFGIFSSVGFVDFAPGDVTWTRNGLQLADEFGSFICGTEYGDYVATIVTSCDTATVEFAFQPVTDCIEVCGSVIMDDDQNCDEDGNPIDWSGVVVLITNTGTGVSYPVHLNPDGSFCAFVPSGKYVTEVLYNLMTLSTECDIVEPRMTLEEDVLGMRLYARTFVEPTGDEGNETTSLTGPARTVDRLTVFPNPTNGELRFDFGDTAVPTDLVSLYDGLGQRVEQTAVANLSAVWRPRFSGAGVYQLVLTDAAGRLKARGSVVFLP